MKSKRLGAWHSPFLGAGLWLCLAVCLGSDARSQGEDAVLKRADDLRSALAGKSEAGLRSCLSPGYLELVQVRDVIEFATRVQDTCGTLQENALHAWRSPWAAVLEFRTRDGYAFPAAIAVDPASGMISDARFCQPWRCFRSRADVRDFVSRLGDATGLYGAEIDKDGHLVPWLDVRGSAVMSVASMMKLYILICITEDVTAGRRSWDDDVELREADRSWESSSGIMHTWPAGTRLSLQAAAALMIGESDNTAADMLMRVVGRARVEAAVKSAGHSAPDRDVPFLSTAEMWKLKYHRGGELGKAYLALDPAKRGAYLDREVAGLRTEDIRAPSPLRPAFVDSVGWFASASDLAAAFQRLWHLAGADPRATPLAILGIKRAVAFPEWWVEYLGAKSGADPGIRAVGYLAMVGGKWHVVVCVVNDRHDVAEEPFWQVARGALAAAGRELAE